MATRADDAALADLVECLAAIGRSMQDEFDPQRFLADFSGKLERLIPHDRLVIAYLDDDRRTFSIFAEHAKQGPVLHAQHYTTGFSPEGRYLVEELGFDGAIDYKNEDVHAGLKRECPKGVDVYFDNVGGDILDAVLSRINLKARIVICGAISQYNNKQAVKGPANYLSLLVNRARMEGMVVFDYASRFPEALRDIAGWLASGQLKSKEDIVEGLETFPQTIQKLFTGENFGKLVLKVRGEG